MRLPNQHQITATLPPLLHHLATNSYAESAQWAGWQLTPASGGANNLVYRAQRGNLDLAIKFTIRDARRRAWREYNALSALRRAGLSLAPAPLWLDETSYPQPVVVQSWLAGDPLVEPPKTAALWPQLITHFAHLHTLTQPSCTLPLSDAVLMFKNGQHGKNVVLEAAKALPTTAQPAALQRWLTWLRHWQPPRFTTPPLALCRNDANRRNFISHNGRLRSVDWENSGWGDPAFEIADLITHPAYDTVPDTTWPDAVQLYVEMTGDETAVLRIQTYTQLMRIWWLIRWSRYLYEIPRGLDLRLVAPATGWKQKTKQKFAQYLTKLETSDTTA